MQFYFLLGFVLVFLFSSNSSGTHLADVTHICLNRINDELVPHPFDCQAYFACRSVPILHFCPEGLLFDAAHSICEVPEKASCVESAAPFKSMNKKPLPIFAAVDVSSGQIVDPMEKYDPLHIECRHFGAYFLPHPRSCQLYYICAYGHLHSHQCGQGTYWAYKSSECQLALNAECYSESQTLIGEEYYESSTEINLPLTATAEPLVDLVTICYIIESGNTIHSMSEIDAFTSTSNKLADNEVASELPFIETPPAESSTLKCPSNRQSYLAHPEDCSKYYICIIGMPVLTSCPTGLFWDQKSGYCDLEKYVECFQT